MPGRLRELLADARAAGEGFESAWPTAVDVALTVAERGERASWASALCGTQEGWRACYERRPVSRLGSALKVIADDERILSAA